MRIGAGTLGFFAGWRTNSGISGSKTLGCAPLSTLKRGSKTMGSYTGPHHSAAPSSLPAWPARARPAAPRGPPHAPQGHRTAHRAPSARQRPLEAPTARQARPETLTATLPCTRLRAVQRTLSTRRQAGSLLMRGRPTRLVGASCTRPIAVKHGSRHCADRASWSWGRQRGAAR